MAIAHSNAPATATPRAPNTPDPYAGYPCIAALVLWVLALLVLVEPVFVLAVVALDPVLAIEPPIVDAVVFAVAEGEALVEPVCFPEAEPAVMTTGTNVMSVAERVAVAMGGMELLRSSAPVTESVHTA